MVSTDEVVSFVILGILLVFVALSGCLLWLTIRCLKKKTKPNTNDDMYTVLRNIVSGEASNQTLGRFEVVAIPSDDVDSFGTYLMHTHQEYSIT